MLDLFSKLTSLLCPRQTTWYFCLVWRAPGQIRQLESLYLCCVSVESLPTWQAWPWPCMVYVLACRRGGGPRKCQSWLQEDRQGTRRGTRQTRRENSETLDVPLEIVEQPRCRNGVLRFDYVTLLHSRSTFLTFLFRPDSGNLSAHHKARFITLTTD